VGAQTWGAAAGAGALDGGARGRHTGVELGAGALEDGAAQGQSSGAELRATRFGDAGAGTAGSRAPNPHGLLLFGEGAAGDGLTQETTR
jgi:hypothetical protein